MRRGWLFGLLGLLAIAGLTVLLLALLTNIFERKQEARQPFVRMVEVTEDTTDPKVWAQNWPFQYDSYLKTSLPTTTKYGGRGAGASDTGPAEQKLDRDPWLKRIFAGYAPIRGRTVSRSRRSRPITTRKGSPTGPTPRPATSCSRRSTRSSRCGHRACTRGPESRAPTATCPTSAWARSR